MSDPIYVSYLDVNFNNQPKKVVILEETTLGAALQDDGGVFSDLTSQSISKTTNDVPFFPVTEQVDDAFYIGSHAIFETITIEIFTSGVAGVVSWEYWNGSTWADLESVAGFNDGTVNLTAGVGNRIISFKAPGDWMTMVVDPEGLNIGPYYFIRARVTTVYSTNPIGSLVSLGNGVGNRPIKYMEWEGLFASDQSAISALVAAHGIGGTTLPLVNGLLSAKSFVTLANGTSFYDTYRGSIKTLGVNFELHPSIPSRSYVLPIHVTTDGDGIFSTNTIHIQGILTQFVYIPDAVDPLDTGADVDLVGLSSGIVIINNDNIGSGSFTRVPTQSGHVAAGTTTGGYYPFTINEQLVLSVVQGGVSKSGTFYLYVNN